MTDDKSRQKGEIELTMTDRSNLKWMIPVAAIVMIVIGGFIFEFIRTSEPEKAASVAVSAIAAPSEPFAVSIKSPASKALVKIDDGLLECSGVVRIPPWDKKIDKVTVIVELSRNGLVTGSKIATIKEAGEPGAHEFHVRFKKQTTKGKYVLKARALTSERAHLNNPPPVPVECLSEVVSFTIR